MLSKAWHLLHGLLARCGGSHRRALWLSLGLSLGLSPGLVLSLGLGVVLPAAAEQAAYVGAQACGRCHLQASENWAHTVHGRLALRLPENLQSSQGQEQAGQGKEQAGGCEACHGPGQLHIANPADKSTILRFSAGSVQPVAEQNARCMSCHQGGQRLHWLNSAHERHEVACSDCHNPMAALSQGGLLANHDINQTCFSCHQQQRMEFNRRSHMPLPEGKLSCSDCHNPHGGVTDPLLKTVRLNDTCFECHAEKRGPFLWEHAPVRDSCMNCHLPHGSNHDMLLDAPRPLICQQCHSQLGHPNDLLTRGNLAGGARPDARLIGRSCSNCHTQIHGSNHPSGVLFHR